MDPALALEIKAFSRLRSVREAEEGGDSEIQKMFKGAVIFITGGTGFLGKQLLEKLFRSCRGIKKVYFLCRAKKGRSIEDRLSELFKNSLYDELKKIYPEFTKRVVPIHGDVTELNLGMSDQDWRMLSSEVNFIFHVAATVKFDEPLKAAVLLNVRGTREVMKLGTDCLNLRAGVYVSTAYSHCNRDEIYEKFYKSPLSPSAIIEMVETMDEELLDSITEKLLQDWPNTYTYSKAIAEETVRVYGKDLPFCVVRPAIVIVAYREPAPGWIDITNINGPSGVILGTGIGLIRALYVDKNSMIDCIPVDYVNNLTIAAAWATANRYEDDHDDIKIYTLSRYRNCVSWGQMQSYLETKARSIVSPKSVWYSYAVPTSSKFLYWLYALFLHFIPALLIDSVISLTGNKFRLRHIYQKAHKMNRLLGFFVLRTWKHHDENTVALMNELTPKDRAIFEFDINTVDFSEFMSVWCIGLRKYIIRDELKETNYAVKMQIVFKTLNYVVVTLYAFLVYRSIFWVAILAQMFFGFLTNVAARTCVILSNDF